MTRLQAQSQLVDGGVWADGPATVAVGPYRYNLDGVPGSFAGAVGQAVSTGTNYIYLDSTGTLTISLTAYPTTEAHFRLARATVVGGVLTSIIEERPLLSNSGGASLPALFSSVYAHGTSAANQTMDVDAAHGGGPIFRDAADTGLDLLSATNSTGLTKYAAISSKGLSASALALHTYQWFTTSGEITTATSMALVENTAAVVITLPVAAADGRLITVSNTNGQCSSTKSITIEAQGGETINGQSTYVIAYAFAGATFWASPHDPGNWQVTNTSSPTLLGTPTFKQVYQAGNATADVTMDLNSIYGGGPVFKAYSDSYGPTTPLQSMLTNPSQPAVFVPTNIGKVPPSIVDTLIATVELSAAGNALTVSMHGDGITQACVVNVVGNNIDIQFQDGVSTIADYNACFPLVVAGFHVYVRTPSSTPTAILTVVADQFTGGNFFNGTSAPWRETFVVSPSETIVANQMHIKVAAEYGGELVEANKWEMYGTGLPYYQIISRLDRIATFSVPYGGPSVFDTQLSFTTASGNSNNVTISSIGDAVGTPSVESYWYSNQIILHFVDGVTTVHDIELLFPVTTSEGDVRVSWYSYDHRDDVMTSANDVWGPYHFTGGIDPGRFDNLFSIDAFGVGIGAGASDVGLASRIGLYGVLNTDIRLGCDGSKPMDGNTYLYPVSPLDDPSQFGWLTGYTLNISGGAAPAGPLDADGGLLNLAGGAPNGAGVLGKVVLGGANNSPIQVTGAITSNLWFDPTPGTSIDIGINQAPTDTAGYSFHFEAGNAGALGVLTAINGGDFYFNGGNPAGTGSYGQVFFGSTGSCDINFNTGTTGRNYLNATTIINKLVQCGQVYPGDGWFLSWDAANGEYNSHADIALGGQINHSILVKEALYDQPGFALTVAAGAADQASLLDLAGANLTLTGGLGVNAGVAGKVLIPVLGQVSATSPTNNWVLTWDAATAQYLPKVLPTPSTPTLQAAYTAGTAGSYQDIQCSSTNGGVRILDASPTIGNALTVAGITSSTHYTGKTLALTGVNTTTDFASIELLSSADAYPTMQFWGRSHTSVGINFDASFDGTNYTSSDTNGNFVIRKYSGSPYTLDIRYHSGTAAGSTFSSFSLSNTAASFDTAGHTSINSYVGQDAYGPGGPHTPAMSIDQPASTQQTWGAEGATLVLRNKDTAGTAGVWASMAFSCLDHAGTSASNEVGAAIGAQFMSREASGYFGKTDLVFFNTFGTSSSGHPTETMRLSSLNAAGVGTVGSLWIGQPEPATLYGYGTLNVYGYDSTGIAGTIQVVSSANQYSIVQTLGITHDSAYINFDSYYDGLVWKSGTGSGGNFQIAKAGGVFEINYANVNTAGSAVTWATALDISTAGAVRINSLTKVSATTPSAGQALTWSGTEYAPSPTLNVVGSGDVTFVASDTASVSFSAISGTFYIIPCALELTDGSGSPTIGILNKTSTGFDIQLGGPISGTLHWIAVR